MRVMLKASNVYSKNRKQWLDAEGIALSNKMKR